MFFSSLLLSTSFPMLGAVRFAYGNPRRSRWKILLPCFMNCVFAAFLHYKATDVNSPTSHAITLINAQTCWRYSESDVFRRLKFYLSFRVSFFLLSSFSRERGYRVRGYRNNTRDDESNKFVSEGSLRMHLVHNAGALHASMLTNCYVYLHPLSILFKNKCLHIKKRIYVWKFSRNALRT